MNSPTVRAKMAAASQVRPTATTQVPAAPRTVRSDTSVVRQQPRPGFQSESQFLTVTSSGTPLDAGGKQEEPIGETSVQAAPAAGTEALPRVTTSAEAQTEHVVYFPVTMIPDRERRLDRMGLDMIRLLRMYSHAHPEALDTRGQIPPRPPYPFEEDPALIETLKTDRHWPEPPLPLNVDWVDDTDAIKDYR